MAEPSSPPERRSLAAVPILGFIVVTSAVVRSIFAWRHSTPRLFPDEYIYAALGRSIGHGHLAIRGQAVHFPGIVEPIFAAPIWRLFPLTTAYHLVQVENAVAVSLTAIPLYLLARYLRLSNTYALVVAVFGLLIPELVLTAYTTADMVAYPLAILAVLAAIRSLDEPTARRQVTFLVLALVATLTRVEYVVLAPAYLAAAVVLDRRAAWRRHRVALGALVPMGGLAAAYVFGYYLVGPHRVAPHPSYLSWYFIQLFLIAIELGVAIVPGVVAGLLQPHARLELAFAAFFGAFAVLLVAAATKPAAEKQEFKERYLFALIALAPIAYGFYVRNARPLRPIAIGVAVVIAVAVMRLPLTPYATATFKTDSQFLFAISESQNRLGAGNSSLVVALLATLAVAVAVILTFRGNLAIPLGVAGSVAIVATVSATRVDIRGAREVRAQLPAELSWVDKAAPGHVTAIETPQAQKADLLSQLYWNASIDRELLLGTATATDVFRAPHLVIGQDGRLEPVRGDVLFHDYGALGHLADARVLAAHAGFTLWHPNGAARLRDLVEGRFWDGWLAESGRIRAWPSPGKAAVKLVFQLSLPSRWARPVPSVRVGGRRFAVRPGRTVDIACSSRRGMLDVPFTSASTWLAPDFRRLAMKLTRVTVSGHRAPRLRHDVRHGSAVRSLRRTPRRQDERDAGRLGAVHRVHRMAHRRSPHCAPPRSREPSRTSSRPRPRS